MKSPPEETIETACNILIKMARKDYSNLQSHRFAWTNFCPSKAFNSERRTDIWGGGGSKNYVLHEK